MVPSPYFGGENNTACATATSFSGKNRKTPSRNPPECCIPPASTTIILGSLGSARASALPPPGDHPGAPDREVAHRYSLSPCRGLSPNAWATIGKVRLRVTIDCPARQNRPLIRRRPQPLPVSGESEPKDASSGHIVYTAMSMEPGFTKKFRTNPRSFFLQGLSYGPRLNQIPQHRHRRPH
jgi:hypothetical protein